MEAEAREVEVCPDGELAGTSFRSSDPPVLRSSQPVTMSLPAASRLLSSALRTRMVSAANLTSKPAKHNLTAGEQAIAMTVLFAAVLGPSGWVLAHLEDYKKRS